MHAERIEDRSGGRVLESGAVQVDVRFPTAPVACTSTSGRRRTFQDLDVLPAEGRMRIESFEGCFFRRPPVWTWTSFRVSRSRFDECSDKCKSRRRVGGLVVGVISGSETSKLPQSQDGRDAGTRVSSLPSLFDSTRPILFALARPKIKPKLKLTSQRGTSSLSHTHPPSQPLPLSRPAGS